MRDHLSRPLRLALLLFIVALLVPLAGAASAQVARVNAVAGEASLVRDGTTAPLRAGSELAANDQITTAADGRAEIEFADGSTLVIGNESEVIIRRFGVADDGGRRGLVDLLRGIVRMALKPGPDTQVDIVTHTAIASVRSTEWIVEAQPETSAVFVITGMVAVAGNGVPGEVVLHPGQGTDVKAGEAPGAPKAWGIGRVREFYARTRRP